VVWRMSARQDPYETDVYACANPHAELLRADKRDPEDIAPTAGGIASLYRPRGRSAQPRHIDRASRRRYSRLDPQSGLDFLSGIRFFML
jgi:hypothetical protein